MLRVSFDPVFPSQPAGCQAPRCVLPCAGVLLVFSVFSHLCVSRHEHRCDYDWQLPWDGAGPAAREGRAGFHSNRAWEAAWSLDESLFGVFRLRLLLHCYCGDCWILHLLLRAETDQPQTAEPQTGTAQDLATDLIGFKQQSCLYTVVTTDSHKIMLWR